MPEEQKKRTPEPNLVIGRNAVLEALNAGRPADKLVIWGKAY